MIAPSRTIVVGGGTAGCIVAARLAEAGRTVTLLEAGPDYGASSAAWPDELLDAASLPVTHDWGYRGHSSTGRILKYERAKVMGGCSSHNGCTQSAGWGPDYDSWPSSAGVGWSARELDPLFDLVSYRMSFHRYAPSEIQPFHRAFLDACAARGVTVVDDFDNLAGGVGAGCPPVNVVDGVRLNTSFAYIDQVRSLPNLTIIDHATVDRVHLAGNRATHVEYNRHGENILLAGDEIVVSAGAYGSPAILQRSGIGAAKDLLAAGITPVVELPGVGRNLHDHPAAQIELWASDLLVTRLEEFSQSQWLPEEQSVTKLRSPRAQGPYDLHLYPWVERRNERWACVFPVGLLTPRSRGSVRVTSPDAASPPVIDSNFFGDAGGDDLAAVRFGVRWILDALAQDDFRDLVAETISSPPVAATDSELDDWIRSSHAHYWHPAGTCRMGPTNDPSTVVDHAGRVVGAQGLRVADASIFPQIPRSTPAWPTAVVGERIAQLILNL